MINMCMSILQKNIESECFSPNGSYTVHGYNMLKCSPYSLYTIFGKNKEFSGYTPVYTIFTVMVRNIGTDIFCIILTEKLL